MGLMNIDYIKKMIAAIDWKDRPLLVDASANNMVGHNYDLVLKKQNSTFYQLNI